MVKIRVNGVDWALQMEGQPLTYAGALVMAGFDPDLTLTVTWKTPASDGTLVRGKHVRVSEGMSINVMHTGAA
jgi:hypothetical protein